MVNTALRLLTSSMALRLLTSSMALRLLTSSTASITLVSTSLHTSSLTRMIRLPSRPGTARSNLNILGLSSRDITVIHHLDMADMACNLLDIDGNHPDNTDQVDTDMVLQNMELDPPDNDMLHHNPSGYNHQALGLAE
ncbi:hypothetical protein ACFX2C_039953 [Malus domestica]